jgi:hypothetical protein
MVAAGGDRAWLLRSAPKDHPGRARALSNPWVAVLGKIAECDDADVRHDPAQRLRYLEHVRATSGVIVLHDGDTLAAGEPRVQFGSPRSLALALGIRRRHEAQSGGGIGIFLTGADQDPSVEQRLDQLGQCALYPPSPVFPMVLRELLRRGLLDAEVRPAIGVAVDVECDPMSGVALAVRVTLLRLPAC